MNQNAYRKFIDLNIQVHGHQLKFSIKNASSHQLELPNLVPSDFSISEPKVIESDNSKENIPKSVSSREVSTQTEPLATNNSSLDLINRLKSTECSICLKSVLDLLKEGLLATPNCGHFMCKNCVDNYYSKGTSDQEQPCPICQKKLKKENFHGLIL